MEYKYIDVKIHNNILVCGFKNTLYMSLDMLTECLSILRELTQNNMILNNKEIDHVLLYSQIPNVFNYGGDLELFKNAILEQKVDLLNIYADLCYKIFFNIKELKRNGIGTFVYINGDAFGGGLETALMFDFIYTYKDSKLSLPEIKFNLFPGMGAYTFIKNKTNSDIAKKIILSGDRYSAEDFLRMNIIDEVIEDNDINLIIQKIIDYNKNLLSFKEIIKIKEKFKDDSNDIAEYKSILDIWIKTCMANSDHKKLALMGKLKTSQELKYRGLYGISDIN